ncbi:protein SHQ1 isoform X1 [Vespula squamosa]|uniref:Protein SHQ1 homolog n=1 Tax=Vespula squamosa TaxID=30214 RepID=A0ABD2AE38_VESSQ
MLTPRFEITQTDLEVTIIVHAPYANIKDVEIDVEGNDFRFYATPYYLRLILPGEIEENHASSGRYDCEKGDFTLKFSKVNKGEFFPNLDMITTLLSPPKIKSTIVPNIEVIGNPANSEKIDKSSDEDNNEQNDKEASNEWFIPQSIQLDNLVLPINSSKYGFANKISGALTAFEPAWIKEIIDLPMPDKIPEHERKFLRKKKELEDFDEQHYMADLMEPECIEPYISYIPEWYNLRKEDIIFNKNEIDLLKEFPNKEYLLDDKEIQLLLKSLIDILYGSCYNYRTTLGDNTVESGWTINKLSSTLCWFQNFSNMDEVINACIRRALCYPILRNWDLAIKVFEDVKQVVMLGRKYIIKRFCEIHSLFNNSYEPRYLLNQLYIKDYLIWLQSIPDSLIESLTPILDNIHPNKEDMQLELSELEEAAYSVQKEDLVIENIIHDITGHVQNLTIHVAQSDKSSDSSTTTDSSDTDTDSESDSSSSSTTTSISLDSDDLSETE